MEIAIAQSAQGNPAKFDPKQGPNAAGCVSALEFKAALFEYLLRDAEIIGAAGYRAFRLPMSGEMGRFTVGRATPQTSTDFAGCKAIALISGPFNPSLPGLGTLAHFDFRLNCYAVDSIEAESLAEFLQCDLQAMTAKDSPMEGQCFHGLQFMPGLAAPMYNPDSNLWMGSVSFRVHVGLSAWPSQNLSQ
jgi:hypothetical protein